MSRKKAPKKAGVYAGSFDPVTRGHLDIIFQAASLLPKLYVVVGVNTDKNPIFTDDERTEMMRHEIDTVVRPRLKKAGLSCDIRVERNDGLTATFMEAHNAPFYVRGLRLGMEFDKEYPSLVAGHLEYKDFKPVFLVTTKPDLQIVSSSLAREIGHFNGKSLGHYVTPYVEKKLRQRMGEKGPERNS